MIVKNTQKWSDTPAETLYTFKNDDDRRVIESEINIPSETLALIERGFLDLTIDNILVPETQINIDKELKMGLEDYHINNHVVIETNISYWSDDLTPPTETEAVELANAYLIEQNMNNTFTLIDVQVYVSDYFNNDDDIDPDAGFVYHRKAALLSSIRNAEYSFILDNNLTNTTCKAYNDMLYQSVFDLRRYYTFIIHCIKNI